MKVLVLPSWYNNSSEVLAGSCFTDQTIALKDAGIDVAIAYLDHRRLQHFKDDIKSIFFYETYRVEHGIDTHRFNGVNIFNLKSQFGRKIWIKQYVKLVRRYIDKYGVPDIVLAHSYWAGYVAKEIKEINTIPFVLLEHSSRFLTNQILEWEKPYIKSSFESADKLLFVGNRLKEKAIQITEANVKGVVSPNSIDTDFFKNTTEATKDAKTILSVGVLYDVKKFDHLIKAFVASTAYNDGWSLRIVGEGYKRNDLEQLIKKYDVDSRILLLGEQLRDVVRDEFSKASFYVSSSQFETFGVTVIEAFSMGLPVVATKCGGPEELIKDFNGLLVENNSIPALQKGIDRMVETYQNYSSSKIRSEALKLFSVNQNVKSLIRTFSQIVDLTR